jgi:hypothetical protein
MLGEELGLNICPRCGQAPRRVDVVGDPLNDQIVLILVEHDRDACHFEFNNAGYWLDEDHDVFMLKPYRGTPERLFEALNEIGRHRRRAQLLH